MGTRLGLGTAMEGIVLPYVIPAGLGNPLNGYSWSASAKARVAPERQMMNGVVFPRTRDRFQGDVPAGIAERGRPS
jgi:hypothetical protein